MIRKTVVVPLLVLLVALAGAFGLIASGPEAERVPVRRDAPAIRVMDAVLADVPLSVRSQGTVVPRTETALIPEISGRVVWVAPNLVSGGFFAADEVLLRIDARDYEATVARAKATLERAEGEVEFARKTLARRKDLTERRIESGAELDDALRNARVSEAMLDDARIALEQAERDLERTALSAPFEGRVRDENVDVGQFASRGDRLATLYATDYVEVRLPVPNAELAFLDLPLWQEGRLEGQQPVVILRANFAGGVHEWIGRIVRTEGEIDRKSRMVNVVARVEDPYRREDPEAQGSRGARPPLAVGLFVKAEIAGPVATGVLSVPRTSLHENRLLVADGSDRLRLRDARVVRRERAHVLVRADLEPGDRVVVSTLRVVVEGMQLQPVPVAPGERAS
jgi:RND family efflux transporter MFP subunit